MTAESVLGIAMQIPEIVLSLEDALERYHGDVNQAAQDKTLLRTWSDAAPESRSALLLSTAWHSRNLDLGTVIVDATNFVSDLYVVDLYGAARAHDGDAESFHGKGFPAMPLPGPAGAMASSLGFDRDDPAISLEAVLILQDLLRTQRTQDTAGQA